MCMEEITKGSSSTTLECSHLYHKNCIKKWWKTGAQQAAKAGDTEFENACPVCEKYNLHVCMICKKSMHIQFQEIQKSNSHNYHTKCITTWTDYTDTDWENTYDHKGYIKSPKMCTICKRCMNIRSRLTILDCCHYFHTECVEKLRETVDGEHICPDCVKTIKKPDECLICLNPIKMGSESIQLSCSHYYHRECIRHWTNTYEHENEIRKKVENFRRRLEGLSPLVAVDAIPKNRQHGAFGIESEFVCPVCVDTVDSPNVQCVACLDLIMKKSQWIQLYCRHSCHKGCIKKWIIDEWKDTCPSCRADLSHVKRKKSFKNFVKFFYNTFKKIHQINNETCLQN